MTPPRRILVIDDDEDQLFVRRLLLERHGFKVVPAATPESALEHVAHVDCVLTDLLMPSLDGGIRLIERLHLINPKAKIVVITGAPIGSSDIPHVSAVFEKGSAARNLAQSLLQLCESGKP